MTQNKKRKAAIRKLAAEQGIGVARAAMLHDREQTPRVQVWSTEWETYVIWGTHSPTESIAHLHRYLLQNVCETKAELEEMCPGADEFRNSTKYWGAPELPRIDETWPRELYSDKPVPGWIPWMVIAA